MGYRSEPVQEARRTKNKVQKQAGVKKPGDKTESRTKKKARRTRRTVIKQIKS